MPSGFSISTDFLRPQGAVTPAAAPAGAPMGNVLNDLPGPWYEEILAQLHAYFQPASYFEIGIDTGTTLALGNCRTVAVDPAYTISDPDVVAQVLAKPAISLFRMRSDDFFGNYDLTALLGGKIDMAFLDGMHRCEFLLRDFINTERHCKRNSIVVLHDCLPVEEAITYRALPDTLETPMPTQRPHRHNWWAGDVWRAALLLKRVRPDLHMVALDAAPTGLIMITNLNPDDLILDDNYTRHVTTMMSWTLADIGLEALFAEMKVEPTAQFMREDKLTAHFWL